MRPACTWVNVSIYTYIYILRFSTTHLRLHRWMVLNYLDTFADSKIWHLLSRIQLLQPRDVLCLSKRLWRCMHVLYWLTEFHDETLKRAPRAIKNRVNQSTNMVHSQNGLHAWRRVASSRLVWQADVKMSTARAPKKMVLNTIKRVH